MRNHGSQAIDSAKRPVSSRPGRERHRGRLTRGFTLVELIVTVGIIVVIASIALPGILYAKRKGTESRIKSDLGLIDTAIAAYKGDFGDIPRFADAASDQAADASGAVGGGNQWLDYSTDRGARLLCFALIAPGPETSNGSPTWGQDGSNGPGFRVRRNAAGGNGPLQGRVYGPYVQVEKFKLETDTTGSGSFPNLCDAKMLDVNGNPILYYPGLPGVPIISNPGTYVASVYPKTAVTTAVTTGTSATPKPLYNAYDNTQDMTPGYGGRASYPGLTPGSLVSVSDMQKLMNADGNGELASGAQATYTGPYILWTAGMDGKFGIDPSTGKTDDIANFDFPAQFRR